MGKRLGSGLLALMLVLGLFLGSMGTVFAGDTYPYAGESAEGENQPTLHGYHVEDLMQWSPETDPYAEMLRAQVPLQNRNAAHKNGVLSLGCMFQPRAYQNFEVMLYKDENGRYPVADKLTEMAKYYGFDGYFFNVEGRSYSAAAREQLKAFFAQMRADGMYIQWYNAGSFKSDMLTSAAKGNYEDAIPYANSSFIEYGHSVPGDEGTAPYGLDKYEAAFNGLEAGRDRWGNRFSRMVKDGVMNGSIASLGTDFVQTGLERTVRQDEETGYNLFSRELDEYQWMAFERERLWWTGNDNNRTKNVNAGLSGSTNDIEASNFKGVANYIAERSVVRGDTFYTNFNTAHGLEYKLNGELSNSSEWSNINLQDILPTWQW